MRKNEIVTKHLTLDGRHVEMPEDQNEDEEAEGTE